MSASFVVGMKFEETGRQLQALTPLKEGDGEGFVDTGSGWSWIAGSESGALERDGVTAEGRSLGVNKTAGNLQIFGTGVKSLRGSKNLAVESSVPIDLSMNSADLGTTITFYTLRNTTLKLTLPRKPATGLLDGRLIHNGFQGTSVVLKEIGQGEHILRVHY